MKKWFLILCAVPFFFLGSCKKDDASKCVYTKSATVAPAAQVAYLDSVLALNSISAVQDSSGVFYTIDSVGSGLNPGICSNVIVTYSGYIFGNAVPFDNTTDTSGVSLALGSLVVGWQNALPHLKAGGKITLYIPPSLGYGDQDKKNADGDVIIPRNSYLKFNIHLFSVS